MPRNPLKSLRSKLRAEAAADPQGAHFYRIVVTVAAVFFVLALLGIARIGWALEHGSVWVNFRGTVLTRRQMYTALALSGIVALASLGIVVTLTRSLRARRG
ncbi:MAG: hypothetical protein ACRETB_08825 [Steroidobacteraceae bacterium]